MNLQAKEELIGQAERGHILEFYNNRSILITGGSGFVGKVLLEKLLRECTQLRHIFVLVRPKRGKGSQDRLREILDLALFDEVRRKQLLHKVVGVEGDVTSNNLGLGEANLLQVMSEVSVVFHSAATVKFDEPLKQSVAINLAGTRNVVDLCRKLPQLAALVHVSTAYANCDRQQVEELVYPVKHEPERLMELASWLDQDTMQQLKNNLLEDKPNSYTYTKSLAEWLLVRCARDLPIVICRPSIVVASWREPFAGWIDNFNGPTGVILGAGKGLIRSMHANPDNRADLIPVDVVINLMISLGWFAHIYQRHKLLNETDSLAESFLSSTDHSSSASVADDSLDAYQAGLSSSSLNNAIQADLEIPQFGQHLSNHNDSSNNSPGVQMYQNQKNKKNYLVPPQSRSPNNSRRELFVDYTRHLDDGYGSSTQFTENKRYGSVSPSLSLKKLSPRVKTSSVSETGSSTSISAHSNDVGSCSPDQQSYKGSQECDVLNFQTQHCLTQDKLDNIDYKLKQFRHNTQTKLAAMNLDEDIADVPVFHCTSGDVKPITWGSLSVIIMTLLTLFPSSSTYRYPRGRFTNNKRLDFFYRWTLHYIPAYIIDFIAKIVGGKAILVKIYSKFDQAASVLRPFTMREWNFKTDNSMMLMNELMSDEDRRLFSCDLMSLDWSEFSTQYIIGVRKFLLNEDLSNLEKARANLRFVYYRNLSFQVLFFAIVLCYPISYALNFCFGAY